ncbi:thioredoxin-disulfide reductase [Candidatus Bipolaricaulota bacterium]|nr:thioredoxin-disulfide reductase [Candidatus Bipolaricaulota bacterium]
MARYEVIIIGGGPAGLTAGLYTSRAGLKSLLVERGPLGGQMVNTTLVENYPGFPEGIAGSELGSLMHRQALRYGLEVVTAEVTSIAQGQSYGVATTEGSFEVGAIIIAAGSEYRKLGVAGEERLAGRGVSYCATCDGFFFRGREVAVVGGGDTAITDALELSQLVSKVYVIHRRDQLRAGQVLQERAFAHPKLEFIWSMVVEEVLGEKVLEGLKLRNVETGQQSILKVDGVFVAIGLTPNSQSFFNILETDDAGYIVTDETMTTSAPGIFAAGDIRRNSPRQIAAAVGDGATAALSTFKYLQEIRK